MIGGILELLSRFALPCFSPWARAGCRCVETMREHPGDYKLCELIRSQSESVHAPLSRLALLCRSFEFELAVGGVEELPSPRATVMEQVGHHEASCKSRRRCVFRWAHTKMKALMDFLMVFFLSMFVVLMIFLCERGAHL